MVLYNNAAERALVAINKYEKYRKSKDELQGITYILFSHRPALFNQTLISLEKK